MMFRLQGPKTFAAIEAETVSRSWYCFLLRRRCIANLSLTESVAEQFSRVLAEPEFECRFRAVVFAILSNPADAKEKFAPLYCLFG